MSESEEFYEVEKIIGMRINESTSKSFLYSRKERILGQVEKLF